MKPASNRRPAGYKPRNKEAHEEDDKVASPKQDTPFASHLATLRELFSASWNDDDLLAVLTELNGDLLTAIARISEGSYRALGLLDS